MEREEFYGPDNRGGLREEVGRIDEEIGVGGRGVRIISIGYELQRGAKGGKDMSWKGGGG